MREKIIAAVKGDISAAIKSSTDIIFYLSPSIMDIEKIIADVHNAGKKIFLHFDLAEGIGKDKAGLKFIKNLKIDGIISTRVNIIKAAKELEIVTVQRFFIVDSHSIDTTAEALKAAKPDMIELMPGVLPKVIKKIKEQTNIPIIAGGLIETSEEAQVSFNAGASAVSTSSKELWK